MTYLKPHRVTGQLPRKVRVTPLVQFFMERAPRLPDMPPPETALGFGSLCLHKLGWRHRRPDPTYWMWLQQLWPAFDAYVNNWHRLCQPPSAWPLEVQALLNLYGLRFSPYEYARDCFSRDLNRPSKNRCLNVEGLGELDAYCHGWPVDRQDLAIMVGAMGQLLEVPQFVLWAANPQLRYVPLPTNTKHSFFERAQARGALVTQPFDTTGRQRTRAYNRKLYDAKRLLTLPRHPDTLSPDGTRRSTKLPCIRPFKSKWGWIHPRLWTTEAHQPGVPPLPSASPAHPLAGIPGLRS